jgi:predicted metal-binding membrane protein
MTAAARERLHVRVPVLCSSAAAWILLVAGPGGTALHAHHSAAMPRATPSPASLDLLLAHHPPASLALDWALMLVAMMAPLLIAPICHVRNRSFARRRARAIMLFVAGYGPIWMAAGCMLLTLALASRLVAPASSVPAVLATMVALVWQFSPAKQSCLNRCHAHAELAAFAPAADIDALRFGSTHGIWCVGSCWVLMLLPLLVSRGHLAAMAAVALWVFAERLGGPMPPSWRWRVPGKAVRLAVAQSRLRLQRA